jgi:hypothetical protein
MSEDSNYFIANGPAAMAFKTNGARIDYGVNAQGRRCGVYGGSGAEFGREAVNVGVGVWGDGKVEGVHGRGSFAEGSKSVGVRGEGTMAGVIGTCAEGVAVEGVSSRGRGGVFASWRAQIRLVPEKREQPAPRSIDELLPADGQTGDLLALSTDSLGASLWFCDRGAFEEGNQTVPALWKQVELGTALTGKRSFG